MAEVWKIILCAHDHKLSLFKHPCMNKKIENSIFIIIFLAELYQKIRSKGPKTVLFPLTILSSAKGSQRSPFGSTEPPSWVYVAVNQRQSWCPEIAERSQPHFLIGWCRCPTRWPRWPESRPLAELSIRNFSFSASSIASFANFRRGRSVRNINNHEYSTRLTVLELKYTM